jgi:hypothetical protein
MIIYGAFDIAKGAIDPRTISDTQRGAMVNWLWLRPIYVTNNWSYKTIRDTFLMFNNEVRLAEVEITVIRQVDVPDMEHKES